AGIAHVIGFVVAGGVVAIFAEADALQELSELPRLGFGEGDGDLDGFHLFVLLWMRGSPNPPLIHRRTMPIAQSFLASAFRFAAAESGAAWRAWRGRCA